MCNRVALISLHTLAGHISANINETTKTFLSLMGSGWLKPFIVKQLCLLFLKLYDNRNYRNDRDQKLTYPGSFGLIRQTQV